MNHKHGPVFDLSCLKCCIALVRSTSPDQQKGRTMLAVIDRVPGAQSSKTVIEAMRST